jgi:hypothetical protein
MRAGTGVVDESVEMVGAPGSQAFAEPLDKGWERRRFGHVERQRQGATAEGLDLRGHGVRRRGVFTIGQHDVVAVARQRQRHLGAQAAAAAGDQGDGMRGGGCHVGLRGLWTWSIYCLAASG